MPETAIVIAALLGLATGVMLGLWLAGRRSQQGIADNARLEEQVRQLTASTDEARLLRDENRTLSTRVAELQKEKESDQERLGWINRAEQQLKDTFEAISSRVLQVNSEEYLKRVREQLDHMQKLMQGDWSQQKTAMTTMVQPLHERLKDLDQQVRGMEEKREGAYKGLEQHISQLRTAYQELRETTTGLTTALTKSSSSRGTWGEMELRRIVELAGMVSHVDFECQESGDQGRPDMLIYLPGGGIVPLDAKTTLDSYREIVDADSDSDRRKKLEKHAQVVHNTVRDLGRKEYWKQLQKSPEFVVMFIPHEGVLSTAFEGDRELLDYSFSQKILLTTPITLLALLKTIAYGWQQQAMAENAQKIAAQGRELYDRISKFVDHLRNTGKALDRTVDSYNETVGSWERRLMPAARNLAELGVSSADTPSLPPIARQPSIPAGSGND